jgi:hypothetical protein
MMLGPFTIDAEGGLSPTTAGTFPSFRFAWDGQAVQARLASAEDGRALVLRTVIGRVASTGRPGTAAAQPRQNTFATLRTLPPLMPDGWTVSLTPDHRIAVEARVRLVLPTRATALLSELTLFVLRLAPYRSLLAEDAGVEVAWPELAEAPGRAKICPG